MRVRGSDHPKEQVNNCPVLAPRRSGEVDAYGLRAVHSGCHVEVQVPISGIILVRVLDAKPAPEEPSVALECHWDLRHGCCRVDALVRREEAPCHACVLAEEVAAQADDRARAGLRDGDGRDREAAGLGVRVARVLGEVFVREGGGGEVGEVLPGEE